MTSAYCFLWTIYQNSFSLIAISTWPNLLITLHKEKKTEWLSLASLMSRRYEISVRQKNVMTYAFIIVPCYFNWSSTYCRIMDKIAFSEKKRWNIYDLIDFVKWLIDHDVALVRLPSYSMICLTQSSERERERGKKKQKTPPLYSRLIEEHRTNKSNDTECLIICLL